MTNIELKDKEQQAWDLIKNKNTIPHPHFFHLIRSHGICKLDRQIGNLLRNLCTLGLTSVDRNFQIVIHNIKLVKNDEEGE